MEDKIFGVIIGVGLLLSISSSMSQLSKDIKRTNSILEKIAKQVGVPEPDIDDEIKNYIRQGKKIKAIKRYREISGAQLKEAKDYIDKLM